MLHILAVCFCLISNGSKFDFSFHESFKELIFFTALDTHLQCLHVISLKLKSSLLIQLGLICAAKGKERSLLITYHFSLKSCLKLNIKRTVCACGNKDNYDSLK